MQDILISIIVPAYNIEQYIERSLKSIFQQTHQNIEVIVVDDGSTDQTPFILDEYEKKESRIHVIHQENTGVTNARLHGVRSSKGTYIGFVDGDDEIEADMFERLLSNALVYQVDISHCGYQMVFHNRKDLYYGTGRLVLQDNITGMKDLLEGSFIEPGLCNKLFHRSLFDELLQNKWMNLTIKNNEDLLMNYYLFREAKCSVYEDVCPYHYIMRADSASKKKLNEHQLLDPLRVTKILMSETEEDSKLNSIVERRLVRQLIVLASMSVYSNPDLIRQNRKNARRELKKRLFHIVSGNSCGVKLKIMSIWTAILPDTYGWVHALYEKITGLDKKYDLE